MTIVVDSWSTSDLNPWLLSGVSFLGDYFNLRLMMQAPNGDLAAARVPEYYQHPAGAVHPGDRARSDCRSLTQLFGLGGPPAIAVLGVDAQRFPTVHLYRLVVPAHSGYCDYFVGDVGQAHR
jgi:hypothetical protein